MQHLGIDLGTTFSLVAYVNAQGVPALFPDFHDANIFRTPSVVHIGEEGCLVGDAVEELLDDEPGLNLARFVKLSMGENNPVYTDHLGRQWLPQSLSALILKKLQKDVEGFMPEDIHSVVITVPANFNDDQRKATKQAAMMSGLPAPVLIEEPIAAATYYGFSESNAEQTLFVYDLGGGTFDATLLQSSPEGLYALATEGHNRIGGKDVDELIMNQVSSEFQRTHGQDPLVDPVAVNQLRQFATQTKLALSKPGKSQVRKTLLLVGKTLDIVITRSQFEQMIDELIEETLKVSQICLQSAGLDWMLVDKILLTGGSSLLPKVLERMTAICGKPSSDIVCKQPHQAVAYGAALIAHQRQDQNAGRQLQRISSYELGIRVRDKASGQPAVKVLIDKNTPVPTTATNTFYTHKDDQKRMVFEIVQQSGKDDNERSLGHFCFMIDQPRKNYPVELQLAYDLEGLVTVSAIDPETGNRLQRVMDDDGIALDETLVEQQQWLDKLILNG